MAWPIPIDWQDKVIRDIMWLTYSRARAGEEAFAMLIRSGYHRPRIKGLPEIGYEPYDRWWRWGN